MRARQWGQLSCGGCARTNASVCARQKKVKNFLLCLYPFSPLKADLFWKRQKKVGYVCATGVHTYIHMHIYTAHA